MNLLFATAILVLATTIKDAQCRYVAPRPSQVDWFCSSIIKPTGRGCPPDATPMESPSPQPQLPLGIPIKNWYYANYSTGPFGCTARFPEAEDADSSQWTMLSSYRSGGLENVHWKYASDPNDPMCLEDWSYYNENATELIGIVKGRVTTKRSDLEVSVGDGIEPTVKTWCALPVYRPGGVFGKQFGPCGEPIVAPSAQPRRRRYTRRPLTAAPAWKKTPSVAAWGAKGDAEDVVSEKQAVKKTAEALDATKGEQTQATISPLEKSSHRQLGVSNV